jgi:transcription factor C subunit 7
VPGTGLHPRPGSASSLQAYFSEIDASWSSVWYPSRKGEDVGEIHARIDDFLGVFIPEIKRRYPGKHSRILLVSHAATVITLARSLLGNRDLPLRVGCCSLSEFTRRGNAIPSWTASQLADGSHLKQGASRDWGFEDIETERGRVSDVCCSPRPSLITKGQVVDDPGVPGTEDEKDEPTGSQIPLSSNL